MKGQIIAQSNNGTTRISPFNWHWEMASKINERKIAKAGEAEAEAEAQQQQGRRKEED